jgi:hypothetical protein
MATPRAKSVLIRLGAAVVLVLGGFSCYGFIHHLSDPDGGASRAQGAAYGIAMIVGGGYFLLRREPSDDDLPPLN